MQKENNDMGRFGGVSWPYYMKEWETIGEGPYPLPPWPVREPEYATDEDAVDEKLKQTRLLVKLAAFFLGLGQVLVFVPVFIWSVAVLAVCELTKKGYISWFWKGEKHG